MFDYLAPSRRRSAASAVSHSDRAHGTHAPARTRKHLRSSLTGPESHADDGCEGDVMPRLEPGDAWIYLSNPAEIFSSRALAH